MRSTTYMLVITVLCGLGGAVGMIFLVSVFVPVLPLALVVRLLIWCGLTGYLLLLGVWSKGAAQSLVLPVVLLLACAVSAPTTIGFFILCVVAVGWLRTQMNPLAGGWLCLWVELLLGGGPVLALLFVYPRSVDMWALTVWLFFLFQSLYFLILPVGRHHVLTDEDRFEIARLRAQRLCRRLGELEG